MCTGLAAGLEHEMGVCTQPAILNWKLLNAPQPVHDDALGAGKSPAGSVVPG
jgi:hypothetical protein